MTLFNSMTRSIQKVLDYSRFLARFVQTNPNAVKSLTTSRFIAKPKTLTLFESEASKALQGITDENAFLKACKYYKYKEYLRITCRDLNGAPQEEILLELSWLAQTIVKEVASHLFQKLSAPNPPLTSTEKICRYSILAMGKLGGAELNYSSDIDLIAFYETDDGQAGNKSLHEFFSILLQQLTKLLTHHDADGFLYRVDWELRPEGRAGTLVNSLKAMNSYYETFGADWERQVYIKARPIAGSIELGNNFLEGLQPFIYRKSLDTQSLEKVRQMRTRIQEEQGSKITGGYHVKIGYGGIRELEFVVQALQLIFGGNIPSLRQPSMLRAIEELAQHKLIAADDGKKMKEAYLFLRQVEHRLQMIDEAQTHFLPDTGSIREHLNSVIDLSNLGTYKEYIHGHFLKFFHEESDPKEIDIFSKALLPFQQQLRDRLARWSDLENKLDELRYFQKDNQRQIQLLENNDVPRAEICRRLSLVAETITLETLDLSLKECLQKYGTPCHTSGEEASILLVAMGKLGGREINYASDLDMIFIYSDDGETNASVKISNREFFSKVIQRFITYISITTRGGKGYDIDSELRPSGKSGPLVISLASFMTYQREEGALWERQALLKARPLGSNTALMRLFSTQLHPLLYSAALPKQAVEEMHHLRIRVENEIAKESSLVLDFKSGYGGLLDIEFILQFLQLKYGEQATHLRTGNTFDGLKIIQKEKLLSLSQAVLLQEAYDFFRTIESKIQLKIGRSQTRWQRNSPVWDEIAETLEIKSSNEVLRILDDFRERVRKIYDAVIATAKNRNQPIN